MLLYLFVVLFYVCYQVDKTSVNVLTSGQLNGFFCKIAEKNRAPVFIRVRSWKDAFVLSSFITWALQLLATWIDPAPDYKRL